jgi:hypothetical protein
MPGAMARAIFQSTAPWAWCARMLETEVNMIVAIAVPSAMHHAVGGQPLRVDTKTSIGTMTAPPPMPAGREEANRQANHQVSEPPLHQELRER